MTIHSSLRSDRAPRWIGTAARLATEWATRSAGIRIDATRAYHRDVMRGLSPTGPSRLITPLMRLQDPAYTKIVIVTLAETTP